VLAWDSSPASTPHWAGVASLTENFAVAQCGMLVESAHIRDLLNANVAEAMLEYDDRNYNGNDHEALQPPRNYRFSLNPIPALVILLLGIMMSSHTQTSMVSSMVHKQWGNLLLGASFARGFTYVLIYLKPPRSMLPSRPPTELLASFGLIAGGIIFMASVSCIQFPVCFLFYILINAPEWRHN
jgi:hypothetical protein